MNEEMDGEMDEEMNAKRDGEKKKGKVDSLRTQSLTDGQTTSLIISLNILLVIFSCRLNLTSRYFSVFGIPLLEGFAVMTGAFPVKSSIRNTI